MTIIMMNVIDIILGTPLWVWLLFGYLIFAGLQSIKPQSIPLWKFSIVPIIFISWSLSTIYHKCQHCMSMSIIWLGTLSIGFMIGYFLIRKINIKLDKKTHIIYWPGSFMPLILSLIFFSVKYPLGAAYAINPVLKENTLILGVDIIVSGLISGIGLGRFTGIVKQYLKKI